MIHFSEERWKKIEEDYAAWWKGELKRPLVKVTAKRAYPPTRKKPEAPIISMQNFNRK